MEQAVTQQDALHEFLGHKLTNELPMLIAA